MKITVKGTVYEYPDGTSLQEMAKDLQHMYAHDIVLAKVNGRLRELPVACDRDCTVEFVTTGELIGHQTYCRSALFLMLKAAYGVAGRENIDRLCVHFSLQQGLFCTLEGKQQADQAFLDRVAERMCRLRDEAVPIKKKSVPTDEAIASFKRYGMFDKEALFKYRRTSEVNMYSIGGFENYFYGYMVPDTGYIKSFALYPYGDGFVLQLPTQEQPDVVPPFAPCKKLFDVEWESTRWGEKLDVDTVSDLNRRLSDGKFTELVLIQEALMEKRIGDIAQTICDQGRRIVLIAGPSSSGKTTFSHRLSIQLKTLGLNPHPIAVDNYFLNREDTPKDADGNYNFECLEALDVKQFNEDLGALLKGEEVRLPTFNFKVGKREYHGGPFRIHKDDVLVIEGIHCLNDKLTADIARKDKFKIYISALTTLNLDEHNRISTTDGRLIRRMVRDARTRNLTASQTIAMWPSVRRGEEENIFPFQEEADVMFNSALIYELAVMKPYAEQLLFGIDKQAPEYLEAKRLLKFLSYFLTAPGESVPQNSLLREFLGGGCFGL